MTDWLLPLSIVALLALMLCAVLMLLERRKARKTLDTLRRMLDAAIDGCFTEQSFDESLLSALEGRLNRYLSASVVSARNLAAEKDKIKTLLADLSHQTKTPLSNLLLYAQLLAEQPLSAESAALVTALSEQTEKLRFLIDSLVKLSRLETGVLTPRPALNPVAPMLREAVGQFAPVAARKGLSLTVEAPEDVFARFDPKWTAEALCNLLDNAVKYTPAGGIHVSARAYELFCRIDVTDTGIGIAEAEQAKVFTRFYRSPAVGELEGVGIGLYLTREILAGQGGYLKLASTPGNGSVFSMFLPCRP
jgi:signal transduction histidine kinase